MWALTDHIHVVQQMPIATGEYVVGKLGKQILALMIFEAMAGVNMRLEAGAIR